MLCQDGGDESEPALSPLLLGDWDLLHTSTSSFDIRNPLGRREDGSAPNLEGLIAAASGGTEIEAPSSSPIQRAIVEAFGVTQSIELDSVTRSGRVDQVVRTPLGKLRLSAAASISPSEPRRLRFKFDLGYLETPPPLSLRIPYPAPFRLLGDEAAGYLDTE